MKVQFIVVQFIVCMLAATCVGTLVFLVWSILEKVFDRHRMEYAIYHAVRVIVVFYLFPLVPIIIYFRNTIGCVDGSSRGNMALQSTIMVQVCCVLVLAWLAGFIFNLILYIRRERLWRAIENTCVEADGKVLEIMERLKTEMGIKRKIQVYVGEEVVGPYVRGVVRPRILLPIYLTDSKDLEYALMHELIHCKNYDTTVLFVMMIAQMIHWYNPIIWKVQENVKGWIEIFTDNQVLYHYDMGIGYAAFLYRTICILEKMSNPLFLGLNFSVNITTQRVNRIMSFEEEIKIKRGVAVGWMAGLFLLACLSVLFTVEGIARTYDWVFDATVVTVMEENQEQEVIAITNQLESWEQAENVDMLHSEMATVEGMEWQLYEFDTSLPAHSMLQGGSFYLEEGQKIDFSIALETGSATVRIQIVNEDKVAYFADIQVDDSYMRDATFFCEQTGTYQVYLENISGVDGQIVGNYDLMQY